MAYALYMLTGLDDNKRALYAACVGLFVVTVSEFIITSNACGPGRLHKIDYASEDILTCKHSNSVWYRILPWILLLGFALLLPFTWYTWVRIAITTEYIQADGTVQNGPVKENAESDWVSRHRVSRISFALLLLASFIGFAAGIHFELEGGWPYGRDFKLAHRVGFVVWAGAFFIVHAVTLLTYIRITKRGAIGYKCCESLYGILLAAFFILYVIDADSAPTLQVLLLTVVWFACLGNIVLGYSLIKGDAGTSFCSFTLMPATPATPATV